jgi:hypothetical protein
MEGFAYATSTGRTSAGWRPAPQWTATFFWGLNAKIVIVETAVMQKHNIDQLFCMAVRIPFSKYRFCAS